MHACMQVQSQEVAALEVAVAALQQQQQQLQQQRVTALPALEEAAARELRHLRNEREKLMQQMASDGDRLLDDLKHFQKAKDNSWPPALPALRAKEKCRDLWSSLNQVKATRLSAAEALTAKLNDALGEARKAIEEHVRARRESEAAISEMIADLRREAQRDLSACRARREEAEEQLLQLLEGSSACIRSGARVEAAILQSSAYHSSPAAPL
ncbi:hypothetical protein Efla_004166 [Eimeria flavescens]